MSPIGADRPGRGDWTARLTELESLVTYFEHSLDQLNEVVTDQATRIEALEQQATRMAEIVGAMEGLLSGEEKNDASG